MGLFDWCKKEAAMPQVGFEERIRLQSKPAKSRQFDVQGRQTDAVRLQHPYLFHVTDLPTAEAIVNSRQLQGIFPYVTLSQELQGAAQQAERKGCALIFQFKGSSMVGEVPSPKAPEVAYHHVGSEGYVETFIAHGTLTPLMLIAISFRGEAPLYDVACVLDTPLCIYVKK